MADIALGGYILIEPEATLSHIIIATGSEVTIATQVATTLNQQGFGIRVVSMPCVEVFLQQPKAYQHTILPPDCRQRIAIEAGSSQSWYQFVGIDGSVIGIDHFGVSAPGKIAMQACNITAETLTSAVLQWPIKQEVHS